MSENDPNVVDSSVEMGVLGLVGVAFLSVERRCNLSKLRLAVALNLLMGVSTGLITLIDYFFLLLV